MGERRWKEIVLQYSFDLRDWTYEWRRCWMLMVVLFYSIFLLLVSIYSCRSHFTHSTHSLGCTHLELLQFLTFTHFEISWSRINEREWWFEIIFQTTYHENIIEEPLLVSPCTCIKWTCSDNVQQHIVRWTVKAAAAAHHSKGIYADNADAQQ